MIEPNGHFLPGAAYKHRHGRSTQDTQDEASEGNIQTNHTRPSWDSVKGNGVLALVVRKENPLRVAKGCSAPSAKVGNTLARGRVGL